MNRYLRLAILILICQPAVIAYAQRPESGIMDKFQNIKKLFDGKDALKNALHDVEKMKTEQPYYRMNVDENARTILLKLRNPFVPKLPVPVVETPPPVVEKAPIDETPLTEPKPAPPPTSAKIPVGRPLIRPDPPPVLKISGLIWDSKRPQAIVNGEIIDVGDTLQKWTVTGISKDGIRLTRQNQEVLITP